MPRFPRRIMSGTELRRYRIEVNASQEELGRYFDVGAQTISDWENGKSKVPTVVAICLSADFIRNELLMLGGQQPPRPGHATITRRRQELAAQGNPQRKPVPRRVRRRTFTLTRELE